MPHKSNLSFNIYKKINTVHDHQFICTDQKDTLKRTFRVPASRRDRFLSLLDFATEMAVSLQKPNDIARERCDLLSGDRCIRLPPTLPFDKMARLNCKPPVEAVLTYSQASELCRRRGVSNQPNRDHLSTVADPVDQLEAIATIVKAGQARIYSLWVARPNNNIGHGMNQVVIKRVMMAPATAVHSSTNRTQASYMPHVSSRAKRPLPQAFGGTIGKG